MPYELLSSEYLNKHIYFTARRDSYRTPDGKVVDPYFVVELPTSVVAMALTAGGEVIMVDQYRHPLRESMLELPGGFIDAGEVAAQSVERELLEETGYTFDSFHYLGVTTANPGVLNNETHMFLALGGKKTSGQKLDANEVIDIVLKPIQEVRLALRQHQIRQSMHALCLFYGFEWLKENGLL